ncbi:MAG: hypothetical protein WCO45_04705 [Pseudanabaena sp. ELA607]
MVLRSSNFSGKRTFILLWTVASVTGFVFLPLITWHGAYSVTGRILVDAFLQGFSLPALQSILLKGRLPQRNWWVLLSASGWFVVWLGFYFAGVSLNTTQLLSTVAVWSAVGATVALFHWILLRKMKAVWWWLGSSFLGLVLGSVALWAGTVYLASERWGMLAQGIVYGLSSGVGMVQFLRSQPPRKLFIG